MTLTVLGEMDQFDRSLARRRSGFGCVRCGCTLFRYCRIEEFLPELSEFIACPACIPALRQMDCGAGIPRTIIANPLALQAGFDRRDLGYLTGMRLPDIRLPEGVMLRSTPIAVVFAGAPAFEVAMPEVSGGAFQLSIRLGLKDSAPQPLVLRNEWVAPHGWTFRRLGGSHALIHDDDDAELRFQILDNHEIALERLVSHARHRKLVIDAQGVTVDGQRLMLRDRASELVGLSV